MPLVGFGLWKVPADQAADTVYNVSLAQGCTNPHLLTMTLLSGDQSRIQAV